MTSMKQKCILGLAPVVIGVVVWFWNVDSGLHPFSGVGFDPTLVLEHGLTITTRSWEYGALVEAMMEFQNPELTVFRAGAISNHGLLNAPAYSSVAGLEYARTVIWTNGSHQLINGDGSPADPASLGFAAIMLGQEDRAFRDAAQRQAEYLYRNATRFQVNSTHAAISHRDDPPELWGDFVYMVPPFLAAYGVVSGNITYVQEAVLQCQLYRDVLATTIKLDDGSACHGLWRHIVSSPSALDVNVCCTDAGVWLTSNAWAVAGIARVLATIVNWVPPTTSFIKTADWEQFVAQGSDVLTEILKPMVDCVVAQKADAKSGLAKNYLDGMDEASSEYAFGDAAGTALMASAILRLEALSDVITQAHLDWAIARLQAVAKHVDPFGKVSPVADVSKVPSKAPVGQTSEGQSMVILMYSAWRDWNERKRGRLWQW